MTNCQEAVWHLRHGVWDAVHRYPGNPGALTGALALAWMCYGLALAAGERPLALDRVHRAAWKVTNDYSFRIDSFFWEHRRDA